MNTLKNLWQNFKERPDHWFFYLFLLTFPLSIKKVIYYVPINGVFNEFSSFSFYLSDIFFLLTILSWIIILYKQYGLLSRYNLSILLKKIFSRPVFIYLAFIVFFSFLSIVWSQEKGLASLRSLKLFELLILALYISKNVPRGTFLRNSLFIIILLGMLNSIIGISQFLKKESLGLTWFGESVVSTNMIGVAKIVAGEDIYIRSYGLFPHPNVFGGFLVLSIVCTLILWKKVQEKNVPRGTFNFSLEKGMNFSQNILFSVFRKNGLFIGIIAYTQILAIIFTASKSAIISLFIALAVLSRIFTWDKKSSEGNSDFQIKNSSKNSFFGELAKSLFAKMFHVEHFSTKPTTASASENENDRRLIPEKQSADKPGRIDAFFEFLGYFKPKKILNRILIVLFFGLISTFFIIKPDYYSLTKRSLSDRLFFLNVSRGTISENLLLGTGAGQYILSLQKNNSLEPWQYQPIHNTPLMVLTELGIWPFLAILMVFFALIGHNKNVPRGTLGFILPYFKPILISFAFISMFDHYFWDIQQGQIMLWLVLGILSSED